VTWLQYEGRFRIGDRVLTPEGPGFVGALYPDTPFYEGRQVQVTREGAVPGDDECYSMDDVKRWADSDLALADPEWDGFESRRDMLAATVYNARAQSPREMTPERWAEVKRRFPGSVRQCLEQADEELADL
jgi:hypothetical protein